MTTIRVILTHVLLAVHAQIQFTHFNKCSWFSSASCDDRDNIVFEMELASSVQCMLMCPSYTGCTGVSFNSAQHLCKGYNKQHPECLDLTTQYYIKRNSRITANTYTYIGCFKDWYNRAMNGETYWLNMTNDVCYTTCLSDSPSNAYFGTQYRSHCFCSGLETTYDMHGEARESECNQGCSGNATQTCGAGWRNSVFFMNSCSRPMY